MIRASPVELGLRLWLLVTLHSLAMRLGCRRILPYVPYVGAFFVVSVAAATAAVGYDLASNTFWKSSGRRRVIKGFALRGSAAAGDTNVDLLVGETTYGSFWNTTTGFPNMDDLMPTGLIPVPAGSPISEIVRDAPATSPINAGIDIIG